ncbi:MAG: hypothetical protein QGI33_07445 [Candidatus Brocadiia bacterium]|nr:hypothetical protein [Candidatus Brocadiia bacterium]
MRDEETGEWTDEELDEALARLPGAAMSDQQWDGMVQATAVRARERREGRAIRRLALATAAVWLVALVVRSQTQVSAYGPAERAAMEGMHAYGLPLEWPEEVASNVPPPTFSRPTRPERAPGPNTAPGRPLEREPEQQHSDDEAERRGSALGDRGVDHV